MNRSNPEIRGCACQCVVSSPTACKHQRKQGIVLLVVVGMLAALFVLAGTVLLIFSVDLRAVGSYRDGAKAFQNADSGASYV
ncbi:MAG: hypothetical protein HQ559_07870, partial [Lentisphaerae bacterium]|nr:hypothetical protein [Lentisphaerota bacterium]